MHVRSIKDFKNFLKNLGNIGSGLIKVLDEYQPKVLAVWTNCRPTRKLFVAETLDHTHASILSDFQIDLFCTCLDYVVALQLNFLSPALTFLYV